MIPIGRPERLGRKTLIIMILRGLVPGLALLVLVILLSFFKDTIIQSLTTNLSSVNEIIPSASANIVSFIPLFIPALFFLGILFGGVGIIISSLQYHFFTFTVEEFGFKLKKGVLHVEEITIPYRQMQDVNVTRPLIYRLFGLSRLVIFSAGHEQPGEPEQTDTVFDPIDNEIADGIRELLGRRIGVQVIEHESEADSEEAVAKSQPAVDL